MLLIENIYKAVEQRAFGHDRLGFSSNEDFNRDFATAQRLLFDYCIRMGQRDPARYSLLQNFRRSATVMVPQGGIVGSPDPSARKVVEVTTADGERLTFGTDGSFLTTAASRIRGNRSRCNHGVWQPYNSGIRVSGPAAGSLLKVDYLIEPPAAVRGVQNDTVNLIEVYDPATTTNPAWPAQAEEDLVQIILALRGLDMESTDLVQFARAAYGIKPT